MSEAFVIAVDGPSGVGKTSVSRGVAETFGIGHLDTGAFYRAATIVALVSKADLRIEAEVLSAVANADLEYVNGVMTVEGIDMNEAIRSDAVTSAVSAVAALASVRAQLVARQQAWVFARGGSAVVEGRDIGTVVFPSSPLKIYLTARSEIRAARRADETVGDSVASVAADLHRRDTVDSSRAASPLMAAEDAVVIDTSDISQVEVIAEVLRLVGERQLA